MTPTLAPPLAGLTVVDFSTGIAGPFATMTLADLGARVIKVEPPAGDPARREPPFAGEEGCGFLALNRNKESVVLNLASAEGRRAALALVSAADVVVSDGAGAADGSPALDADTVEAANPRLVHAVLSPFGSTGPLAGRPAGDLVLQAATGGLSATGEAGRAPAKAGLPLPEATGGLFAAIAVLAAVEKRDRTGAGCRLDLAHHDAGLALLSYMANIFFATGESPRALGSAHQTIYPYNAFETADGHIVAAPFTQAFWRKFCQAIGRPDLAEQAAFRSFGERIRHRAELAAILEPILRSRPSRHWLEALDAGDVPNGPVNSVAEALAMEQTGHRGMTAALEGGTDGPVRVLGTPFHLRDPDGRAFAPHYRAPPRPGEHTRAVLDGLACRPAAPAPSRRHSLGPPLAGLRVLDLTRMLAGPFGALVLADLGAEVIKVEEPRIGDPTRRNIPFVEGESTYFMAANRGKRSITLDLKAPAARDALLALVREADVVIENYRPGVMERLGLSLGALARERPGIILCSISGYGQTGPLRDKISFDLVNQAMAGVMGVTGEPGRPPVRTGVPVGDLGGGLFGALGVLAALHRRRHGGGAVQVDIALHDGLLALLGPLGQRHLATGEDPGPLGAGHAHSAPHGTFQAADRLVAVEATEEATWRRLAAALGRPDLAEDPRFRTAADRKRHEEALGVALGAVFATRPAAGWEAALADARVPCSAVLTAGEALESAQSAGRRMVFAVEHPVAGLVRHVGLPFLADGQAWRSPLPAPLLGEANAAMLEPAFAEAGA